MKRLGLTAFSACAALIAASGLSAHPVEEPPIRTPLVGLEGPQTDACPGIGRVNSLEPRKGDLLRVRAEANEVAKVTDELAVSTLVWLCEADEDWQGIVYPKGEFQELGDCRVSSALAKPEPYSGPCHFGWVEAKYVELVAG